MNAPETSVELKRPQSIADLGTILGGKMKQIKSVIASNLTPEKMARIALNELRNNDYLAKIAIQNPDSFVNSVVQASHLGLEIGGTLGQAYLVPYKGEIKMMPGYRGLISLARRSGEITSINAEIVYEKDEFDLELGVETKVTHKPFLKGPRGEPRLAYMVAKFKDGGNHFEWMTIDEIMSIKARSAAVQSGKKTPWDTDRDEMIRKTIIRRGWKYLPMSIEMQTAQIIDSANEAGKGVVIDGDAVVVTGGDDGGGDGGTEDKRELWADSDFRDSLPKWQKLIADGKKTAEQIITMANTRAILTPAQEAIIKAPATPPAGSGITFAQVEEQLLRAKGTDSLAVAADLIGEVGDHKHREELTAIYKRRQAELSQ